MTPEIAQSLEDFVSWRNSIACAVIAFDIAIYFLAGLNGNTRRRLSALIDFFWTTTSATGIAAGLVKSVKDSAREIRADTQGRWEKDKRVAGERFTSMKKRFVGARKQPPRLRDASPA